MINTAGEDKWKEPKNWFHSKIHRVIVLERRCHDKSYCCEDFHATEVMISIPKDSNIIFFCPVYVNFGMKPKTKRY